MLTIAVASAVQGWAPVLDPTISLLAPLVGTLAGALAGIVPAHKASRITPLDALQR